MSHPLCKKVAHGVPLADVSHNQCQRGHAATRLRSASWSSALARRSRLATKSSPLMGAIRDRDRQMFFVRGFEDARFQRPATAEGGPSSSASTELRGSRRRHVARLRSMER
jgi:hypothetical protein